MTPEQIITASNAKTARLEHKVAMLEGTLGNVASALNDVSSLFEAQTKARYQAMQEAEILHGQVRFLENYVAFITEENAAATEAATAHFEKLLAAANWSTSQWSQQADYYSSATRDLQEKLASKSKEDSASEREFQEMLHEYTAMKATLLQREIEKENAERDLKETERLLREAKEATQDLIKSQKEVNSNLINQNKILAAQKRKQSKEAIDARAQAKKESVRCDLQLKETKKMIAKSKNLENQLQQKVTAQEKFQRKCDTIFNEAKAIQQSRDYYKSKDAKQSRTIQRLKDQVLNLESAERTSAFTKAIKDLNIEVDDLKSMKAKLQKDLDAEKRVKELSLSKAKEQAKTIKETKKMLAHAKGAALGDMDLFLKKLRSEKLGAAFYIATEVTEFLQDIKTSDEAGEAFEKTHAFLDMHLAAVHAIMEDSIEVEELVEALLPFFKKTATGENAKDAIAFAFFLKHSLGKRRDEEKQTETE
ncbi:hypothetical protein VCV18_008906 [Metarhizium anisopliae]